MVLPSRVQFLKVAPQIAAQFDIHTGGRFIENEQLRVMNQSARENDAALEAAGQFAELFLGVRHEIEFLDQHFGAALAHRPCSCRNSRPSSPISDALRKRVDVKFLRAEADVPARLAIILHRIDAENFDRA